MWRNSKAGYGWWHIALHWLMAVLILGLFGLGLWMVELNYYSPWYKTAPFWHKGLGALVFLLLLMRLVLRLVSTAPMGLGNKAERLAAGFAHIGLYLLPLALIFSGYLISTADGRPLEVFDLFSVPALISVAGQEDLAGEIHALLAWLLIGLVVLHLLAALKHHFIDKDQTLLRMLRPEKEERP